MTTNVKASLEITKGATAFDPIALDASSTNSFQDEGAHLLGPFPTEEEWATLPRVSGSIPWQAWTVAAVEFVERFSYYGTSAVCTLIPVLFTSYSSSSCFSRQLYPEGSPTRLQDWCRFPQKARIWRARYGPACFHWSDHVQPVLVLHHSSRWCLAC